MDDLRASTIQQDVAVKPFNLVKVEVICFGIFLDPRGSDCLGDNSYPLLDLPHNEHWAVDLECLVAIALILGSSTKGGSSGLAQGRSGNPRVMMVLSFSLQNRRPRVWPGPGKVAKGRQGFPRSQGDPRAGVSGNSRFP